MFQVPVNPEEYKPVDPIQQIMSAYYNSKKMQAIPDEMEQAKQMTAAHLAQMAAQTQLYGDQSTEAKAHTGLYSAQTGKANAETANMPTENLFKNLELEAKFGGLQNSSSRFGKFYQLNQFVKTPEGAQALATNPEFAKNYLESANSAAYEAAHPNSAMDYSSQMNLLRSMRGGGSLPSAGAPGGGAGSGDYAAASQGDYASTNAGDYAAPSSGDYATPADYSSGNNSGNTGNTGNTGNAGAGGFLPDEKMPASWRETQALPEPRDTTQDKNGYKNILPSDVSDDDYAPAPNANRGQLQSEVKGLQVTPAQKAALDMQYDTNEHGHGYVDQSGNPVQVDKLSLPQQEAIKNVTDAQIQTFQNAAADEFQKKTNTANTLNQRKAITSFVNLFDDGQQYLPGYLRYIQAAKKANLTLDKFSSAVTGKNNPDLDDYNNFRTTILPSMANEYRKIMGGQASDAEQKMVDNIIDPNQWWASPESAVSKLNSVYKTVQGFARSLGQEQSATVDQLTEFANRPGDYYSANPQAQPVPAQAPPPVVPGQMRPGQPVPQPQQVPPGMTVNPAQLQTAPPGTAQQLGMQAAQAASQQGAPMPQPQQRSLPIPQFRSQAEATAWFAQLPPKYRQALIQQKMREQQMLQQQGGR